MLADMKLDAEAIAAALMHDLIEDTPTTLEVTRTWPISSAKSNNRKSREATVPSNSWRPVFSRVVSID